MPYLSKIVKGINNHILKNALADKRFQGSDFNGIAYALQVNNTSDNIQIMPCIPQSVGEYKGIMFNDAIPLIVYHKVSNKQYIPVAGGTYGRNGKNLQVRASMSMIVLANRKLIRILPEELDALIVLSFADGKEDEFKNINTGLSQLNITPVNSDLNFERIWAQEYKGYDFEVNADRAMLSVNYNIESTFNTKCFRLCDCTEESASN